MLTLLTLLTVLSCVPRHVPPAAELVAAPQEAAPVIAPPPGAPLPEAPLPEAPLPEAPPPVALGVAAAPEGDVRDLVNDWKHRYNTGLARLEAGDAVAALEDGRASLATAPAEARLDPLVLIALAAGQAGEVRAELDALEALMDMPRAPWGVFYNGSLDASAAGESAIASRLAQAALRRTKDVATVAPVALRAALVAGDLDAALVAARASPLSPGDRAALERALVTAGRCGDATRLGVPVCR